MKTSAERKEADIKWREKHAGSGPSKKAWDFRDDDQDKIIPEHGRKGRGRLGAAFSAHLAKTAFPSFYQDDAAKIVVNDITADSTGMSVILDTSVVVESLLSPRADSPSRRLMELALADSEEIVPYVTNTIVYEYRRVLGMFGDYGLEQLYRLLFRSIVIPVLPDIEIPPVEADHSDTPFVEALVLAMRGSVGNQRSPSRLATNDHHLLKMSTAEDSTKLLHGRIVTPRQILQELHR